METTIYIKSIQNQEPETQKYRGETKNDDKKTEIGKHLLSRLLFVHVPSRALEDHTHRDTRLSKYWPAGSTKQTALQRVELVLSSRILNQKLEGFIQVFLQDWRERDANEAHLNLTFHRETERNGVRIKVQHSVPLWPVL